MKISMLTTKEVEVTSVENVADLFSDILRELNYQLYFNGSDFYVEDKSTQELIKIEL